MVKQQIKIERERLKRQHRDRLIAIGIRAVDHVIQPSDLGIKSYLDVVRNRDRHQITEAIRKLAVEKETRPVTRESILHRAAHALLSLSISEKYINGLMLDQVLASSSNSFVFTDDTAQQKEIIWQDKNLRPLIDQSFKQLQADEKELRKGRKLAA
jgi:hypothetical protein